MLSEDGPGNARRVSEEFTADVRHALSRLYDPTYMRRSPLAALFGVADRVDAPALLQGILTDAIQALRPRAGEPAQSLSWCLYNLLCSHYVQQLAQPQVANQLGISERTMRRRQRMAVRALAEYLWKQLQLQGRPRQATRQDAPTRDLGAGDALAWLRDAQPGRPTAPAQALSAALEVIAPLASQHAVCLRADAFEGLPEVAAHPVAFKQIIVNLLHMALLRTVGGEIVLSAQVLGGSVQLALRCTGPAPHAPLVAKDESLLEVTRQMVALCHGSLALPAGSESFVATVTLPVFDQLVVLAVDDQPDALQLLERYVSGTRYRLVGTREPAQVVGLAEKHSPRAIVVDIMMPDVDGWSVLASLRQHALTKRIPTIVCTVLPQAELALSLGADAFIQKPLSRQAFLEALDRLVELGSRHGAREPGSR